MKASNPFKEAIKAYLDQRAANDELFAATYQKENKNLEECCNYVMQRAKSEGCVGYTDEEVFGWAVHYYDEDDIKNIKPVAGKVVVNHKVELSEDDIQKAKQDAIDKVVSEQAEKLKKKKSKKEQPKSIEQPSLFD